MLRLLLFILITFCTITLDAGTYRVFFRDKGGMPFLKGSVLYRQTEALLTKRALARRALVLPHPDSLITLRDAPVFQEYISAVSSSKVQVLLQLRWQNYIVVRCDSVEALKIAAKPFVRRVEPTGSIPTLFSIHTPKTQTESFSFTTSTTNCGGFRYGSSLKQNALMNAHELHSFGITGEGVLIGVLDNGFRWKYHQALSHVRVAGEYDFIFNDTNTENDTNDVPSQDGHGSPVFGAIAGLQQDSLIGVAPYSSFLLAKTEDMRYELRIEEDNYAAAIEWMEALGADISTSSLGYYGYDSPDSSYKYENMNGRTSVSAVACNYATRMGMICISAAGNSGGIERTINTPGDADSVFSVGAFANDTVLRPAGFTSKGPTADGRMKPDIAALGEGVTSYRHVSTNEVGRGFTGTSFSTPLIAGAAALLKSAFPELRTYEVRKLMQSYASSFNNPNNAVGFGMPDLLASSLAYGILCSPPLSYPGRNAHQISYRIKSNSPLTSVRLIYRKKGESEWKSKPMLSSPNDYVVARLPHYDIGTTGVLEFYVEFESNHKRGRMPADITSFSTTDIGSTSIPCGIAQADIPTSIEVTVTTTPLTPTVIQSENGVHVWCPPSAREARIYSVSGEIVETIQLLEGHGYLAKQLATGLYFCSAISESQRHTTTFMVVR